MIVKGIQHRRMDYSSKKLLEEIGNLTGVITEQQAKYYLYKLFRNNPNLATKYFLGMELFPFQTIMIKGMFISDYSMFVLSRGSGKCVKKDEIVYTQNGAKKAIDVEIGDTVQSFIGQQKVEEKLINPIDKVYNVKTSTGYESGGLDYHRLLTFNEETIDYEWKYAKDLQVGDNIVIRKGFNYWPEENDIRLLAEKKLDGKCKFDASRRSLSDWYYFWGLFLGDGCYNDKKFNSGSMSFFSGDAELAKWVDDFWSDVCLETRRDDSNILKTNLRGNNLYKVNFTRKELVVWMKSLGFNFKFNSDKKIIPYQLLNNSKENISAILSGLFDTDGWCSIGKNRKGYQKCEIGFCSTSHELINQVSNLLLNYGIVSIKIKCFNGGASNFFGKDHYCKPAWSISINNTRTIKEFQENIGFRLERKKLSLENAISNYKNHQYIKIPCGKYILKKYGAYHPRAGLKLSYPTNSVTTKKLQTLYDAGIFDDEDSIKIKKILETDIYYDKVKEVTVSEDVTVDLQIANEKCYYSNGFVSHNTLMSAIYCLLSNILEESHIGIISSVFRASKQSLLKADSIMSSKKADMARSCGYSLVKGTDQWTLKVGNGETFALPLGDGQKMRGFRFNRLIIDEFLNVPKKAFEEVILPFISSNDDAVERERYVNMENALIEAGKMKEEDRRIWASNKLILLSSPSFKFEYMYEVYSKYLDLIQGRINTFTEDGEEEKNMVGEAYRLIYQMSYDCVPKQLYDVRMIKQAKETMSEMNFKKEFGAQFVDESDGFFKLSKMMACTIEDGEFPAVEVVGDAGSDYILAIDPNASETETADNFAMLLFKLNHEKKTATIVHAYAIAGLGFKEHIYYLKYLLTHFNIVSIVADQYGGGDQFIKACNESQLFKEANLIIGQLEGSFNHLEEYKDDLKILKQSYQKAIGTPCYLRAPMVSWINSANTQLQGSIDHKKVFFGSRAIEDYLKNQMKKDFPIETLQWNIKIQNESGDINQLKFNFIENLKDLVEQCKVETANIEVRSSPTSGQLTFNLAGAFKNLKGKNRPRKDLYSCLVLGNWFVRTYFDLDNVVEEQVEAGFMPFFV